MATEEVVSALNDGALPRAASAIGTGEASPASRWEGGPLQAGVVVGTEGPEYLIAGGRGLSRAERATSCLVAPEADDFVLWCEIGTGAAYVLAVLERPGDAPKRIGADGDMVIEAAQGRLTVTGRDGVGLQTARDVSVVSQELRVASGVGNIAVSQMSYLGRVAEVNVERLRTVAATVDRVAGRVLDRVKRAYRFVEELDVKRAKHIDHCAEGELRIRADNAVLTARELVKMDGAQIHLG